MTLLTMATPVHAAPEGSPALSDSEITARLNATGQALQSQQTNAEYWEYGWGGFDGGTMVWSAAQASSDENRRDRATDIVQATESLIGLADVIFRPLPAFNADSACDDPLYTHEDQLHCLTNRETLLEQSAERAHEPYEILPHLGNLGFNLLAGYIVYRVADKNRALITAIPGEIIGEIQLETTPSQPMADLHHYNMEFGPLLAPSDRSHIPAAGMTVTFRF